MEIKKEDKFYRVKWFWNIVKNGLFLLGVRNRLARIGIDIMPYYWVKEGAVMQNPPEIRGDNTGFSLVQLNEKDLIGIHDNITGLEHKKPIENLKKGDLCYGIKKDGSIAAYMFTQFGELHFRGATFVLAEDEAYLKDMYTFEASRGKNMAPYLRYQVYLLLREKGYKNFYSISEYFNKSTLKFKAKLNAVNEKLMLSIKIGAKKPMNWTLRRYNL